MKKSNVIVFVIIAALSAFLLWLWFFLGFNYIDDPLDLVLSVTWWVLVALACIAVYRVERKRRERIRTCYLADGRVYNTEMGMLVLGEDGVPEDVVECMHDILKDLEYGFKIQGLPDEDEDTSRNELFNVVVRSRTFKITKEADEDDEPERESEPAEDVAGEAAATAAGEGAENAAGEGAEDAAEGGDGEELEWKGEVAIADHPHDEPYPFDTEEDLRAILALLAAGVLPDAIDFENEIIKGDRLLL